MTRRYRMVPVVAWVLRIAAGLAVVYFIFQLWQVLSTIGTNWATIRPQFGTVLQNQILPVIFDIASKSLIPAVLLWGFADLLRMTRDIAHNARMVEAEIAPILSAPTDASKMAAHATPHLDDDQRERPAA
jgi:hypothetical protein